MSGEYIEVSGLGRAFLPGKFTEACSDNPIRRFTTEEGNRNQAMGFLKRGGAIVVTGRWEDILSLYKDILKRENELISATAGGKERTILIRNLRQRVLTTVDCLPVEGINSTEIPGFVGEDSLPDDAPALIPIQAAEQIIPIPHNEHFVRAINASVVSHPDVLVPLSQETIDIMYEAIESCKPELPDSPKVLEIGCGSGVLSIAVWRIFEDKSPEMTATDILPEAVATTRLNWRRLVGMDKALTTRSGNLFDPVKGQRFDLIIFNAPWVVAPAKTRLEFALNDDHQRTIGAFIQSSPDHLNEGGRVIIGYAENAGPKAIARLEEFYSSANLSILRVYKDRISTHRAKRRWQNIYAYVLGVSESLRH